MRTLGNILMLTAAAALIVFPPLYHFRTRGGWRRSAMGVHLMSFMGALGMVMVFAIANIVAGPLPEWVRPFVWLTIAGVSWWRVGVLIHETRRRPLRK